MSRNLKTFFLTGIAVATTISCAYAEGIFEANFSGTGYKAGKGNIVSKGGSGKLFHYSTNKVAIKNKAGNGYLEVIRGAKTTGGQAGGVIFTPANANSSWGAMYRDGKLNGAIDFFFSSNVSVDKSTANSYVRIFDNDNRRNGGLRINLQNVKNRLLIELIGPAKNAFVRSNGQKTQTFHIAATKTLKANVDYHIAVTFKTNDKNITTCAMYVVDENKAIVIGTTLPIAKATFALNKDVIKAGFTNGHFRFGKLNTAGVAEATQRFGRLILYDTVPDKFEALNFKLTSETYSEVKKK